MKPENLSKENLPANRVIRKRFAARTTAIHVSALPPELESLAPLADGNRYLAKHRIPSEVRVPGPEGAPQTLSRDEAWKLADRHGEQVEGGLLYGTAGKVAAFFSTHGQGIYANFGRPSLDFSGFFHDYIDQQAAARACHVVTSGSTSATPANGVLLGPLFIAFDTTSAAGLTALGHVARSASLRDRTVATDVLSTGVYEGSSAYATAKLGVITGAKAMGTAAALPIPGACVAAFAAGFLVGALTAVVAKRVINDVKDVAVDRAFDKKDRASELAASSEAE